MRVLIVCLFFFLFFFFWILGANVGCAKVCRQLMKVFAVLRSAKSSKKSKIKGLKSKWHALLNIQNYSPHAWMFGFWRQHITHSGNNTAQTIIQEMSMFTS